MSLKLKKQSTSVDSANNNKTFKVAVLGEAGVGKTAFIVRFVTSKFIGDYDSDLEFVYQYSFPISLAESVLFEILDTPTEHKENPETMEEKIKWADGFILLYAVTDQVSFSDIVRMKFLISHIKSQGPHKTSQSNPPVVVVGNKKDADVDRMVSFNQGKSLADSLNAEFFETSVRESVSEVVDVFMALYNSYKLSRKNDCMRTKSTSYLDLNIRHHHHYTKKKQKSFKHINKVPRMLGSPEMARAAFRKRCGRLYTDSEHSDTGDERQPAAEADKRNKTPSVANLKCSFFDLKDDLSSDGNSNDDACFTDERCAELPISEASIQKIAEEFNRKTVLLSLK